MYLSPSVIKEMEARYSHPLEISLQQAILPEEMKILKQSKKFNRAHDVTFFIFNTKHEIALIRKPGYPPRAYRAPSGGIRPGEDFETGIKREAREETGLEIELTRYLLRVSATFSCPPEVEFWTSHVFTAQEKGGTFAPQDTQEVEAVRYGTFKELQGPIRQALLATGKGLFRYRVTLTDAVYNLLSSCTP